MIKPLLATLLCLLISQSLFAAEYWIDVRVPEQYQAQHIKNAINVPLKNLESGIQAVTQNREDTLYLYCNSGRQSGFAEARLKAMGYKNVIDMGGLGKLKETRNIETSASVAPQ